VILSSNTCLDVFDYPRSLLEEHNLFLLPGADLAMKSIGAMVRWVDRAQNHGVRVAPPTRDSTLVDTATIGAWAEDEGRDLLRLAGVPVVPSELVTTVADAIDAALEFGYPVAMKVCSRDIPHKTDVGGVRLGVAGAKHVHDAFEAIIKSCAQKAPDAEVRGVLISPMRPTGIDLLVGVTWDDTFGPVLTVGLGGVWVEVMKDVSVRVLPVSDHEVHGMLLDLRGSTLLAGGRGSAPVDLEALTRVIQSIASAAMALGNRLEALEVNPLRIGDAGMEALDVLVTTRGASDDRA
jgi:acyl-CoA synthetase (NDP forming)